MKYLVLVSLLGLLSGCATVVTDDYKQYVANNQGQNFPAVNYDADYVLTTSTKSHSIDIRSAMAGYGNKWSVKFGDMLQATLQSPDVQKSFKSLNESTGAVGGKRVITFDLKDYTFADHHAKVQLGISVSKNGKTVLDKTYSANGNSQGGKMFWGGGMAMKNAIQQSSKSALDTIFRDFMTDLKAMK